jgi:hypothetical protein
LLIHGEVSEGVQEGAPAEVVSGWSGLSALHFIDFKRVFFEVIYIDRGRTVLRVTSNLFTDLSEVPQGDQDDRIVSAVASMRSQSC